MTDEKVLKICEAVEEAVSFYADGKRIFPVFRDEVFEKVEKAVLEQYPNHTELPGELFGRLYNWKFASALELVNEKYDVPQDVRAVIEALASVYGNIGWDVGGHSAVLINAALKGIANFE